MQDIPTIYKKSSFNIVCFSRKLIKFVIFIFINIFAYNFCANYSHLNNSEISVSILHFQKMTMTFHAVNSVHFLLLLFFRYLIMYINVLIFIGVVVFGYTIIHLIKLLLIMLNSKLHIITFRNEEFKKDVPNLILDYLSYLFLEVGKGWSLKGYYALQVFNYLCAGMFIIGITTRASAFSPTVSQLFQTFHITRPVLVFFVIVFFYFVSKGIYVKYFHNVFEYYLKNYFNEASQVGDIQDYFMRNYAPFFKAPIRKTYEELRGRDGYQNERNERQVVETLRNRFSSFLIGGSEEILLVYEIDNENNWFPYMTKSVLTTYRGLKFDQMINDFKRIKQENFW